MLSISFDFDEQTQQISNLKVVSSGKPKSTTCDLEVLDNKISLSPFAISKLNAVPGDRIAINYWTVNNTETFPIISKADLFDCGDNGNKLTKSKTVSFKGQQRTTLLKFGSTFIFEEFVDNSGQVVEHVFKLVPGELKQSESNFEEEEKELENTNSLEIEDELATMLEGDFDSLPF